MTIKKKIPSFLRKTKRRRVRVVALRPTVLSVTSYVYVITNTMFREEVVLNYIHERGARDGLETDFWLMNSYDACNHTPPPS